MATTTTSPYNENTDWDNEYAYLAKLATGGSDGEKAWATNQLGTLRDAQQQYATPMTTATTTATGAQDTTTTINQMYDDYVASQIAQAQNAYNQSNTALDAAETEIPQQYQAARDSTAVQSAMGQQAFNEYANANGLNSGAGGQAWLARTNTLQGNLSSIDTAQANALADIATQRANLQYELQAAISEAQATGNYNRASALYQEMTRLDEQELALQQYNDSLAASQTETVSSTGWALIQSGIMPSAEQLAAMGISSDQASAYILANTTPTTTYTYTGDTTDPTGEELTFSQLNGQLADMYAMYYDQYSGLSEAGKQALYNYIASYGGAYTNQFLSKYGLGNYTPTAATDNATQTVLATLSNKLRYGGIGANEGAYLLYEYYANGQIDANQMNYIASQLGLD